MDRKRLIVTPIIAPTIAPILSFSRAFAVLAGLVLVTSCAPGSEKGGQPSPDLHETVNSLQQGDLINELNQDTGNTGDTGISPPTAVPPGGKASAPITPAPTPGSPAPAPPAVTPPYGSTTPEGITPAPTTSASSSPTSGGLEPSSGSLSPASPSLAPSLATAPCASLAPGEGGGGELSGWLSCLSDQYRLADTLARAFDYFRRYRLDGSSKPFSAMSERELDQYLAAHGDPATDSDPKRSAFSDPELVELQALAQRHKDALARAADAVTAAFRARPGFLDALAASSLDHDRLLGLLAGGDFEGPGASAFVERFWDACYKDDLLVPTRADLTYVPADLLRLFGLEALLARRDALSMDLSRDLPRIRNAQERYQLNPVINVLYAQGDQQGEPAEMARYRGIYARYRDRYQEPIPAHAARDPRPVRVTFMDTGVDYLRYARLIAPYLGNGPGELQSFDYADDVQSPYAPAVLELRHGTGTLATLLTLISHEASDILEQGKLEVSEWKVVSTRNLLAGIWGRTVSWENREDRVPRALIGNIQQAGEPGSVSPDIVSISMVLYLVDYFRSVGMNRILLQAPWLWVMAAGNDGMNVKRDPATTHGCFTDFPATDRDDTRILCVGALIRGRNGDSDRIAGYSNYGSRVDVYAYSTYDRECPNGTSCATPAITAAAAILKARFPRLTPAQIKNVIVGSAVTKTLEVDPRTLPPGIAPGAWRTVRVFDPPTMMDRALQYVQEHLAQEHLSALLAPRQRAVISH